MMIKYVDDFKDYEVLDCGDMEKIERFGDYILRRPDPQAIWHPRDFAKYSVNAIYHRSKDGGGKWEFIDLPKKWTIKYELDDGKNILFNLKPFTFKHTGVFPEQAVNWKRIYRFCSDNNHKTGDFKVLNLFAYTGGATISAALAGAKVTHVDAAKGIITWAKENVDMSNVGSDKVRWIVDDCKKFVERENRRKNLYDGIIMDPPSYGRGPGGEVWKLEEYIYDLVYLAFKILKKNNSFLILNSYTTGLGANTMDYIVNDAALRCGFSGDTESYDLGLKCKSTGLLLPEGQTVMFTTKKS